MRITILMCLCFVVLCSSVIQPLKMTVKLAEYKYPDFLKKLDKQRMEDSENLSVSVWPQLASVK